MDALLTWCSRKHDGEEVDAHSDGVEDGKSSEAVGYRVSLWKISVRAQQFVSSSNKDTFPALNFSDGFF